MSSKAAEEAVRTLEEAVRRKRAPGHHLARHVLLALGEALREAAPASAPLVERVRSAGQQMGPAWTQAIETELTLACGEFAQCLDPRYLQLSNYDVEYTRSARALLEDRIRAARELGFELPPRERNMLELADRVLATYLTGREGGAPASSPGPPRNGDQRSPNV